MAKGDEGRARSRRVIARNKRATHEYLIQDELEVGIVLTGTEVKSLRAGRVSLQEAFCFIKDGELVLDVWPVTAEGAVLYGRCNELTDPEGFAFADIVEVLPPVHDES